jgi:archaetidylinositol phosphate synthase
VFEQNRERFNQIGNAIAKYFTWLDPNIISTIGLFIGMIPAVFYVLGYPVLGGISLIVYLFDSLDGAVARITGKVSKFGEVYDATLDRVVDGAIIFSIAYGGFVSWELAFIVLLGYFLVPYTRARAEAAACKKIKLNVGIAQRGDRVFLLMIASILFRQSITLFSLTFNTLEFIFIVLAFLTWQTFIFRIISAYKALKPLENGKT